MRRSRRGSRWMLVSGAISLGACSDLVAPGTRLNPIEEQLVGLWYGRAPEREYFLRFNEDRTACLWARYVGLAWRFSESPFVSWSASPTEDVPGSGRHRIALTDTALVRFEYDTYYEVSAGRIDAVFTTLERTSNSDTCSPALRQLIKARGLY